jgi:folate-dependent tRNA-U54 methylase TrmFO/GidA
MCTHVLGELAGPHINSPTVAWSVLVWHTDLTACILAAAAAAAGYEEAASQGLLAGLNAARRAQELDTVILPRDSSYMGTLMDDLVTKDLREPYRMLTSRCGIFAQIVLTAVQLSMFCSCFTASPCCLRVCSY